MITCIFDRGEGDFDGEPREWEWVPAAGLPLKDGGGDDKVEEVAGLGDLGVGALGAFFLVASSLVLSSGSITALP